MFYENCKKEIPFLSEMVVCPFCKADIKKRDVVADLSDLVATPNDAYSIRLVMDK